MINIPPISNIAIKELKSDDANPNVMSSNKFEALKKNIKEFGFIVPIITNKDLVIADGFHRYKAAQELNMVEVPVVKLDVDEVDRRILRQVLNKLHGEHDLDKDRAEFIFLEEQNALGKLAELLSEEEQELYNLAKQQELSQENKEDDTVLVGAYERAKNSTKIKEGDIFQLGDHRLICGDSTGQKYVRAVLGEDTVDMLLTDPPYNVDYSSKNDFLNNKDKGNRNQQPIKNDKIKNFKAFLVSFLKNIPFSDYNTAYTFMSGKELHNLILAYSEAGLYYSQDLKWVKNNHVLGRLDYAPKSENIVYGWKGRHKFYGPFTTDVLEFNKPHRSEEHPTMKPVELLMKLIMDGSQQGMIVYDGFGGSGSTLIACEQLNRKCRMIETDPVYCQIIIERWQKLTEKEAVKL